MVTRAYRRNITSNIFLARRNTDSVQGRDPARADSHNTTWLFEEEKGERGEDGKREKGEREGGDEGNAKNDQGGGKRDGSGRENERSEREREEGKEVKEENKKRSDGVRGGEGRVRKGGRERAVQSNSEPR